MKLFKKSLRRPLAVLGMAALAGGGTAIAQTGFTGIGTTDPDATLHVATAASDTSELERIIIENILELSTNQTDSVAAYSEVLLYDSSTGIIRRESITDMLDESGEWVFNGTTIEPRRFTDAMDINASGVQVGTSSAATPFTVFGATTVTGATTITGNTAVTGTFGVTGNSTLTGTLNVTGNVDFDANANVDGTLDIGTVAQVAEADLVGTDEILIQQAGTDLVEYVTVADLMSNSSYWQFNSTTNTLQPSDSDIEDEFVITPDDINITAQLDVVGVTNITGVTTVTGATTITGNTDITGTFDVDGNSNLDGTLGVTGNVDFDANANVDGTLDIGTVAQVAEADLVGTDEILIQQAGTDLVEYVTVADLMSNSSYWQFNSTTNTLQPSDSDIEDEFVITPSDINITAQLDVVGVTNVTGATTITGNTAITGTFDVTGDSEITGTFTVDPGADGITLEDLAAVTDVSTQGSTFDATTNNDDFYDRVLITDEAGVVRYIDAEDLVASAAEWVFDDADASGAYNAGDVVYLRRAGQDGTNDVFVTFEGQMVVDAANGALRFGGATNQINATGITASAAYTQAMNGGLTINSVGAYDVNVTGASTLDATTGISMTAAAGGITATATAGGITATATAGDVDVTATAGNMSFTSGPESTVSFKESGTAAGVSWLYYAGNQGTTPSDELGRVGINTETPAATLHVAGNMVASNSTVTSDRRFKRDIEEFQGALDAINALRGVKYGFRVDEFPAENFDDSNHIGFIAQEVREVLPESVFERTDGFLTVDYGSITPVLAEAVQELSAKVAALEAENAALRGVSDDSMGAVSTKQFEALQARLAEMDARLEAVAGRK